MKPPMAKPGINAAKWFVKATAHTSSCPVTPKLQGAQKNPFLWQVVGLQFIDKKLLLSIAPQSGIVTGPVTK
ncbi:hypothetical protein [Longitalea luteola]|uniref:hypothetical protein n=1 Tax=Longitalea luteola TaxID=2812563 RepID=UPI001A96BC5A|nr:hypothetical protein [Longitalea luteola]